jgi:hypothetical protein
MFFVRSIVFHNILVLVNLSHDLPSKFCLIPIITKLLFRILFPKFGRGDSEPDADVASIS